MRFVVDLERVTVILADPDDVDEFAVVVAPFPHTTRWSDAADHRLKDVLAAANVGALADDGTVRLREDAIRFHASGQVADDWERRFAAACAERGDGSGAILATAPVHWPA